MSYLTPRFLDHIRDQYTHIRQGIKWNIGFLRGFDKLRIGEVEAKFRTEIKQAAQLNRLRFQSEHDLIADLISQLQENDVFYDIGANTGLYSMFAGQLCQDVVAFEPYGPNVRELKANAKLNDLDIQTITKALSNQTGEIKFRVPDTERPGYGSAGIATEGSTHTVAAIPGDRVVDEGNVPPPTVVKIDVEGAEPLVLEGLSKALSHTRCRYLYCEIHLGDEASRPSVTDFGTSTEQIKHQIEQYGFDIENQFVPGNRDGEIHVKATKNTDTESETDGDRR